MRMRILVLAFQALLATPAAIQAADNWPDLAEYGSRLNKRWEVCAFYAKIAETMRQAGVAGSYSKTESCASSALEEARSGFRELRPKLSGTLADALEAFYVSYSSSIKSLTSLQAAHPAARDQGIAEAKRRIDADWAKVEMRADLQ